MAEKNLRTMPYKQILINIHPNFPGRLRTRRKGGYVKGVHSGLSIYAYMAFLFEINEYLGKEHKLTDYQIARALCDEYPGRKVPDEIFKFECGKTKWVRRYALSNYRNRYNLGTLLYRRSRHGPISYRYDEKGNRISFRGNAPISAAEQSRTLGKYGPENRQTQDFDWSVIYKRKKTPPDTDYESFNWSI